MKKQTKNNLKHLYKAFTRRQQLPVPNESGPGTTEDLVSAIHYWQIKSNNNWFSGQLSEYMAVLMS